MITKKNSVPVYGFHPGFGWALGDAWDTILGYAEEYLPQAATTASQLLQAQAQQGVVNSETERLLAEAETTTALGKLRAIELNTKTVTVIALVAGAGILGYFLIKKRGRK